MWPDIGFEKLFVELVGILVWLHVAAKRQRQVDQGKPSV